MSLGTLYSWDVYNPGAHRSLRILATAALAKQKLDLISPDIYTHNVTNRTPEWRKKFPTGQAPALETKDGQFISEGSAIALYIARNSPESGLIPADPVGEAQVAQWQGFVDFSILVPLLFVHANIHERNKIPTPAALIQAKVDTAVDSYAKLDVLFADKAENGEPAFLIGSQVTLADIAVVSGIVRGFGGIYDAKVRAKYPHVTKYAKSILAIPEVAEAYRDGDRDTVVYAEISPFDPATYKPVSSA